MPSKNPVMAWQPFPTAGADERQAELCDLREFLAPKSSLCLWLLPPMSWMEADAWGRGLGWFGPPLGKPCRGIQDLPWNMSNCILVFSSFGSQPRSGPAPSPFNY